MNITKHGTSANLERRFRYIGAHQADAGHIESCEWAELKMET